MSHLCSVESNKPKTLYIMETLLARNLKNKPHSTWSKYGVTVYYLYNGYWLTSLTYSSNFNTISEVKNKIKEILKG